MKKPKISLDSEKIQAFFLNHVEKILLAIVLLLMVMLVLSGLRLPHLSKEMTPEALVNKSNTTRQYIDAPDRWNEVSTERMPDFKIVAGVEDAQKQTVALAYALPNSLSRPDFPKLSPREDPQLYAPINLVARPVVGALASYPDPKAGEYHDPLYPTLSEDEIKKQKAQRQKAAKAAAKKADLGGEGPGGMPGDSMPGPGGRMAKKGKTRAGQGEDGGYPGESMRGARGRGPGGGMPGGSASGSYVGAGMGEGGMAPNGLYQDAMMYGYQVQDPQNTIARDVASITLMAVVPFQKQIEEFEKKLAQSLDYDPKRDYPNYLDFRVQRVDVTELDPSEPVPDNAWKTLGAPQATIIPELLGTDTPSGPVPGLYAGVPVEVSDPTYLSDVLTLPAPPYLQRDLWDLLTHPDVPLYTGNQLTSVPGSTAATPAGGDEDAPTLPMMRPGGGMAGPGSESGGYGPGMRGGYGGMPGGAMRMPGGGSASEGAGGYGGGQRGGYSPMRSTGGYGSARGGEDSGYGSAYGTAQTYTPPKYQLIRFIDTHVERGHKYRYRIRVFLDDPNHPDTMKYYPPSIASLHGEVQKRIKALDESDAKRGKTQQGLPFRTSWVMSPWSEPSAVIELPQADRALIAKAQPERRQKIKNVDVPAADPSAEVLALSFDHTKIADVPGHQDKVTRGSVLNFNIDKTKVIHPVTKEPIELDKYAMQTDILVADLMGGETMRAINTQMTPQSLTALGEMLVVDANGKLRVHNEAQDIDNIRRFAVPKEDPNAAKANANADAPGGLPGDSPRGRPAARGRPGCF